MGKKILKATHEGVLKLNDTLSGLSKDSTDYTDKH